LPHRATLKKTIAIAVAATIGSKMGGVFRDNIVVNQINRHQYGNCLSDK